MSEIDDKVEGLEKTIKELTGKVEAAESKAEGANTVLQQQKQEVGDLKKEYKELAETLKIAKESGDKAGAEDVVKKLIDKMEIIEENVNKNKGDSINSRGSAKEKLDGIMKKVTQAQKEKADSVFKRLPAEERIAIDKDPEKAAKFISAAIDEVPSVPDSLFSEPTAQADKVNEYKTLFKLAANEANNVPLTTKGGSSGYPGADSTETGSKNEVPRRLAGGVIPRPANV